MSGDAQKDLPPGVVEANGHRYMVDAKGALIPIETVKETHRLEDSAVRALMAEAIEVAKVIASFKAKAFADVDAFVALLEEAYNAKAGGEKGNLTLASFDGTMRIQVQVSDNLEFGPELKVAKIKVDECLTGWSADSGPELRAIVNSAFQVDKEGQVNRAAMFNLLRLDIKNPAWVAAMDALRDSIRVVGSKRYIRFHRRASPKGKWEDVSLNVATA